MRNRITNGGIKVSPKVMHSLLIASSVLLVFLSFGSARADTSLADIIAKVKSFPVPGGEVVRQLSPPGVQPRVYLIAMPNVRQPKTEYRGITFNPGDKVQIVAGGCVNPGVTISFPPIPPSRRYVDPIDKNGSPVNGLYGQINIPGAINGLQPIKNYNNKTVQIPTSGVNPASLYLSLGYSDSNYGDNTYMPLDPGERGQCSITPVPAFVALTITPAKQASKPSGGNTMATGSAGSNTGTSHSSGAHAAEAAPKPPNTGQPVSPTNTGQPVSSTNTGQPVSSTNTGSASSPQKGGQSLGTPSYGTPTTGSPSSSYAVTCAAKIPVETHIDDGWLSKNVGASASSANANQVEVLFSRSSKKDGYVSCHYKSAKGDIYNLIYNITCKNAVATGANSFSCAK